jgi:hypothetical protein
MARGRSASLFRQKEFRIVQEALQNGDQRLGLQKPQRLERFYTGLGLPH